MTKPKYKPILFAAPMVMAILEGRKTQTRRLNGLDDVNKMPDAWDATRLTVGSLNYKVKKSAKGKYGATFISHPDAIANRTIHVCPQICPYGQPGDRLWVKESFRTIHDEDNLGDCIEYAGGQKIKPNVPDDVGFKFSFDCDYDNVRWRSSRFMPRWASRINLEITGVRVERVQDISEDDAIAEGVDFGNITDQLTGEIDCEATDAFEWLWQSLHGPDSWDKNPWVWVIEFKRV